MRKGVIIPSVLLSASWEGGSLQEQPSLATTHSALSFFVTPFCPVSCVSGAFLGGLLLYTILERVGGWEMDRKCKQVLFRLPGSSFPSLSGRFFTIW